MIEPLDKKILYALDINARLTHTQIARQVRSNRNIVAYRIQQLEKQGIIRGYFTEINNHALGLTGFRVFFRFRNHDKIQRETFFENILTDARVAWCFSMKGTWDADVVYWAKDRFEFYELLAKLKKTHSHLLAEVNVATIVDIWHYPKRYLTENTKEQHYLFGHTKTTLSDAEQDVLNAVAFSSRKNIITIAQETNLSVNTVKKHMKTLKEKGIILRYRPFIDINAIGYQYVRLHLSLKDYDEKIWKSILTYISDDSEVAYLDFYVNGDDIEIEYHVQSEAALDKKLDRILSRFGTHIMRYQKHTFDHEYVVRYMPKVSQEQE